MSVGKLFQMQHTSSYKIYWEKIYVNHCNSRHTALLNVGRDAPNFRLWWLQPNWSYDRSNVSRGYSSTLAVVEQHKRLLEFYDHQKKHQTDTLTTFSGYQRLGRVPHISPKIRESPVSLFLSPNLKCKKIAKNLHNSTFGVWIISLFTIRLFTCWIWTSINQQSSDLTILAMPLPSINIIYHKMLKCGQQSIKY